MLIDQAELAKVGAVDPRQHQLLQGYSQFIAQAFEVGQDLPNFCGHAANHQAAMGWVEPNHARNVDEATCRYHGAVSKMRCG
ncbi:hypothetical protein D3C73_1428900 [compost metagenome]